MRVLFLILALLMSAWPASVSAQSIVLRRPALHWVRTEEALSCIDPRTLADHVEALIGPVLVRPSEAEHTIEGQVDLVAPGRLRVRVRVLDIHGNKVGERQFEQPANDCTVLTPAIVFVIGMAIDPEVAAHGLPPALVALLGQSEPPPEEALLKELEQTPAQPAVLPPRSRAPIRETPKPKLKKAEAAPVVERGPYQATGFVRGALGEAPRAMLSADARFLYTLRGPFSVGGYLRGGGQLGGHEVLEHTRDIRTAEAALGLLACAGQSSGAWLRIQGCLGVELSALIAWGSAFANSDVDAAPLAGVVGQLTARIHVHAGWGVALLLTGRFATRRRSLAIDDPVQGDLKVARLPWLSGGVGLGPSYEF